MKYPTYQDLNEALQNQDFIKALTDCTLSNGAQASVPWSISHVQALVAQVESSMGQDTDLDTKVDYALFTILGTNVSTLSYADPTYLQSLVRNPNIREGVGAFTLFGTHVLSLAHAPVDRMTVVAVTLDDDNKPCVFASASSRIACRVAALLSEDALVTIIAQHAHELNRQYCLALGDTSQPEWKDAPDWQQSSALNGVRMHLANPGATPEDSHASWLKQKEDEGWVYGPVKDPVAKTHPCMMPYSGLPDSQRAKDYLFRSAVHQLSAILKPLTI
jgi:hypothetical protein